MTLIREDIIAQCEVAASGVVNLLSDAQAKEALEYILRYDEWLVGLEFIIDWLYECDKQVTPAQFIEFEKAYQMMSLVDDERLLLLKSMVASRA